jgi:hypothetical protein
MRTLIAALFLTVAVHAQTFPALTQINTGAAPLGSGSSVTSFTFVVAGDNRPAKSQGPGPTQVVIDIAAKLAANPPAFVLWDGDTIAGKKPADVKDQYKAFRKVFSNLSAPLFNAPGNHEMALKGSGDCSDAPDASGQLLAAYVKHMAPAYGMFRYGNSAFVAVNTDDAMGKIALPSGTCSYNGFVSAKQLAALQSTLAQLINDATIQNIFLFMHRPVHDDETDHQIGPVNPGDENTPYGKQLIAFTTAINAIKSPKVSFIFASHDHRFYAYPAGSSPFTNSANGPTFLITGGAGAPLSGCKAGGTGKAGAYYHWLQVGVNGASVTVTVMPLNGTTLCGSP